MFARGEAHSLRKSLRIILACILSALVLLSMYASLVSVFAYTKYLGDIRVTMKYYDGSPLTPETLILYDQNWQELKRDTPSSNVYTFANLSEGTYNVEAYADDMYIGSVGDIVVHVASITDVTIQTQWPKRLLTVTAYYSDATTPCPGITVRVHSWDGYHNVWNFRYEGTSNDNGQASFLLWPTTISKEKYKVEAIFNSQVVGSNDSVRVDKNSGGQAKIVTSISAGEGEGNITITVKYYDGSALTPETLILYNKNWQEVSRANPISNVYTFSNLSTGTYHVEAYADDMLVGYVDNIPVVVNQTTYKTIQTQWPKRPLGVTAYYNDTTTPFPSAVMRIYSWDGYHKRWNYRYEGSADSKGQTVFSLWPTTLIGEKYKVSVIYNGSEVGTNENVFVDKNDGGSISITTSISPPSNEGALRVAILYADSSALVPETLILYNKNWQEITRANPTLNVYEFNVPAGVYHVETYCDDMFVGAASDISVQAGQRTETTITTWWKRSLSTTIFYSDGSTPFVGAVVKVYSWDGYHGTYNFRCEQTTGNDGKTSFVLWPTTLAAENYKLEVYYGGPKVGEKSSVKVDKDSGGTLSIVTSVAPQPGKGSIQITVQYPSGAGIMPETLILYNSNWNEIRRANPSSNVFSFTDLPVGVYNVEAYADDMYIGSSANIGVQSGQTSDKIITTFYRRSLAVTVYSDQCTPLSGAIVRVYSWDGYHGRWNYRYQGITSNNGKVSFFLWPTTLVGEKYKVEASYDSRIVGSIGHVLVDKNNGGSVNILPSVLNILGQIRFVFAEGETFVPVPGLYFDGDQDITNNYRNYNPQSIDNYLADQDGEGSKDVPVYIHVVHENNYYIIEIWLYYAYDNKALFGHEHDFEYLFLWVDKTSGELKNVAINQHRWTNNYEFASNPGTLYIAVEKNGHGMILLEGDANHDGYPDDLNNDGLFDAKKPDNCAVLSPELIGSLGRHSISSIIASLYAWEIYDENEPVEGFGDSTVLVKGVNYDLIDIFVVLGLEGPQFYLDSVDAALNTPILLASGNPWALNLGVTSISFYIQAPWTRAVFDDPEMQWNKVSFEWYLVKANVKIVASLVVNKLVSDILAKILVGTLVNQAILGLFDPVQVSIMDSSNNILGYRGETLVCEIPGGMIFTEGSMLDVYFIVNPTGDYAYLVKGIGTGNYNMTMMMMNLDGSITEFDAKLIPTENNTQHKYTLNWVLLKENKNAVTLLIDQDGDGVYERTIQANSDLEGSELALPWWSNLWWVMAVISVIAVGTICVAYYRQRRPKKI